MKQKGIFIDTKNRDVKEVEYETYRDIQALVGSPFCIAMTFENGDVLFVDDEGLINGTEHFFTITGGHQPFAGSGLIVGAEETNEEGEEITKDPETSLSWVKGNVQYHLKSDLIALLQNQEF